jgi:hypothetical protein
MKKRNVILSVIGLAMGLIGTAAFADLYCPEVVCHRTITLQNGYTGCEKTVRPAYTVTGCGNYCPSSCTSPSCSYPFSGYTDWTGGGC